MSKLITLRLPDGLAELVDAMAQAEGMNRSQYIIAMLSDGQAEPKKMVEELKSVQVSRSPVVVPEPTSKPAAKIVQVGCKCGGSGVTLVGGKRCCAGCGRALGD